VSIQDQFRSLPSVDELARRAGGELPHALVVRECQAVLEEMRARIRAGLPSGDPEAEVTCRLAGLMKPSLRRVINAAGVILHTNLGRAPLPELEPATGYSNLEYDLEAGQRGKRDAHTASLLRRLLGAPALLVNNGAAAVFLALHELAAEGEVVVSRGELIEIGDGFRIPDIMARSGARLVEVGTTNRTRLEDYRRAITPQTRLLMRVHPSNFRISGFTGRPSLEELVLLGREAGIPVYEDLGSGCLVDLSPHGIVEPTAQASLEAGADLISFSGDKLLGGPQAGILAGRDDLVERLRRNPMFRALRVDKLIIGAMETTLRHLLAGREEELPVLRMIRTTREELLRRAERFLASQTPPVCLVEGHSLLGGGSTPDQVIPSPLLSVAGDAVRMERALRAGTPPVIARIEGGRLLIDLRTVDPQDDGTLLGALQAAAR
jgi:L-seryl-tRNA(Ser) seleniumtransferase